MDALTVSGSQLAQFRKALLVAPDLTNRFVRQEMTRGGRRIVKAMKKEWLSGGKGINAPQMRKVKDKNIRSFVEGKTLSNLALNIKGSKFIRTHVLGATIRPRRFQRLFLRENKTRGGGGTIVATAEQIIIRPRIDFQGSVEKQLPALLDKLLIAASRAVKKAMDDKIRGFAARFAA
jgi:hypothetical protein